jgi:pyroglutamyl-peptidase
MATILVTGFEPFGEHRVNPSERVVRALAGEAGIESAVLPVSFRRAAPELLRALDAARPDALLLLGAHSGDGIRLERVALNLDDAESPDNDGETRSGRPILATGPVGYFSTLPLDAFAAALTARALPFAWSHDAGGFLCNHAFYLARDWAECSGRDVPCGFVHLPPPEALPLERQIEGVGACLDVLRARLSPAAARGRASR